MVKVLDKPGSLLLLDELFESGDDRFLAEVFACIADARLKGLAGKWMDDPRPWARRMLLAYIDDGCDRARHRALVKALLRRAEAAEDDELMAHFLCAFDRLKQHEVRVFSRWDWYAKRMVEAQVRVQVYPPTKRTRGQDYWRLRAAAPKDWRFQSPYFSSKTRQYLQRRAYRYFRLLGARAPDRFREGVLTAMALYRQAHIDKPEHVVDAYGIVNLLFYDSVALRRTSRSLTVAYGRQVADLVPTPVHADAWRGHAEMLLSAMGRCDCLLLRRWLQAWLAREEADALRGIDAKALRPLLLSSYGDVQVFAVGLLEQAQGLGSMAVAQWLELLALDDPELLPIVVRLVEAHVTPSRLDLAQLVLLACMRATPVAELGFRWLSERKITTSEALREVMALANADAEGVRVRAVAWLLGLVTSELGAAEHLRDLIDARHEDVRRAALSVMTGTPRFSDAPALWLALSESPYPDVRRVLLSHLTERQSALPRARVEHVWATTLLAVHRGSRDKRAALRQIAARVAKAPAEADALLPILRLALRSVRETERRAALASVATAAFRSPALRDAIGRHIPELTLFADERVALGGGLGEGGASA